MQDLIGSNVPTETRHLTFKFLECLLRGQFERLGMMRLYFFKVIQEHKIPADISCCFDLLQALTDNGREFCYFEDKVTSLCLSLFVLFILNFRLPHSVLSGYQK